MSATRLVNRVVFAERGRTSVRLEPEFWDALRSIAVVDGRDVNDLVKEAEKLGGGRTSAVRVFVLGWFRDRLGMNNKTNSFVSVTRRLFLEAPIAKTILELLGPQVPREGPPMAEIAYKDPDTRLWVQVPLWGLTHEEADK